MGARVHRKRLTPVVGGMTVAVTATGVVATTHVAPALAEPASVAIPSAAAGGGVLESCDAYFGYGKNNGAMNVVEFDVVDANGDDGVSHAVPDDTEVVLVVEGEDGTIECTPFEVTEDMWDDEHEGTFPRDFPFPGPGRYAYPSVMWPQSVDGIGQVTNVGFRVTEVPADHTLVSPTDLHPLDDHFLEEFGGVLDPRSLDHIATDVSQSAADNFEMTWNQCVEPQPEIDETDPELLAAVQSLHDLSTDGGDFTYTEVDCFDLEVEQEIATYVLGVFDTSDYVETISLSTPEPESTTSTSTTSTTAPGDGDVSPAAEAVTANPTFTG